MSENYTPIEHKRTRKAALWAFYVALAQIFVFALALSTGHRRPAPEVLAMGMVVAVPIVIVLALIGMVRVRSFRCDIKTIRCCLFAVALQVVWLALLVPV